MLRNRRLVFIHVLFLFLAQGVQAQLVLTYDQYVDAVLKYHPLIKQTKFITSNAEAKLLAAKSAFDPVMQSSYDTKELKNIDYFKTFDASIKSNTNSPISVSAGLTNNLGERLNPNETNGTVSYLGVNVPLLKNFIIDENRAQLQQMKIQNNLSIEETKIEVNNLVYAATEKYIEWHFAYKEFNLNTQYVSNLEQRMDLMRETYKGGDKSVADTIEMFTQLQSFRILQSTAKIKLINKVLSMSYFLWDENNVPYVLSDEYKPDTNLDLVVNSRDLIQNNPLLKIYEYKQKSLAVESRLYKQSTLPILDFGIKAYGPGNSLPIVSAKSAVSDNLFYGFSFKYPILTREAKSKIKLLENKLLSNKIDLDNKQWELSTKSMAAQNEISNWAEIANGTREIANNLNKLLELENLRFQQGESSVFMINARENKLFENLLKLNEVEEKTIKAKAKLKLYFMDYRVF